MKNKFPEIQYITQDNGEFSHARQAAIMFEKGIKWVQIRMKNARVHEIVEQSREALHYAKIHNCKLIINDSVEITKEIGAHGVHLGQKDTPVCQARKYLGDNYIIGGTANTFEEICLHASKGADYVGVGPYRFTQTKKNLSPILGLSGYKKICKLVLDNQINIPIYAIGGITQEDKTPLLNTGVHGVAMSTGLLKQIIQEQ